MNRLSILLVIALITGWSVGSAYADEVFSGDQAGQSLGIESVPNLRDLGGYQTAEGATLASGLLYRSNQLYHISPEDMQKIANLNLKFVYDLRTYDEMQSRPEELPPNVSYVWLDVLADSPQAGPAMLEKLMADPKLANKELGGGKAAKGFVESYREFVSLPSAQHEYRKLYLSLANPDMLPALFHCTTGKDRTGWAAAALLTLLGVPMDVVMADYLRSNDYIIPLYQEVIDGAVAMGIEEEIPLSILGVRSEYLEAAFDEMETQYGTIENYFSEGLGIDANQQQALRDLYLGGAFNYDQETLSAAKPWTSEAFQNNPEEFQFVIIGDRTGGANVSGTFALAIDQLNLLQPEFVINVGDLIEGYSDDKAELNAEWDDTDKMLKTLNMPFFRTPGNHDIANPTAQEVWLERYGVTRYHFVYKDVLFLVIDSEDPPRVPPEGIKEKLDEYNRLQIDDPPKAKAMLAEFMADESVVAGLGKPVDFSDEQIAWIGDTLAKNPDVRWTFLFLHDPVWENPSESFEAIQQLLKKRDHTFIAGHLHYYDYDEIDGVEHITMGPTGASFHQEGPGNVDHVMWVTMTEDGPQMGNIALKSIFDRKGLDPELFGAYDRKGVELETPVNH